jgi:hypothetical protein
LLLLCWGVDLKKSGRWGGAVREPPLLNCVTPIENNQ